MRAELDLGISGEDDALLAFRSGLVLASRLAGVAAPVDGVCTAIHDPAPLAVDAARARRLGDRPMLLRAEAILREAGRSQ